MREKKELNNPKPIFEEKGGIDIPGGKWSDGRARLTSIRRSEVTSIVPDDMNWNKIFAGRPGGPHKA